MTQTTPRASLLGLTLAAGLVLSAACAAQVGDAVKLQDHPPRTIRVRVLPVPSGRPFRDANLIITVEDVSAQDVGARLLARKEFKNVSYDGRAETVLLYTLDGLRPAPKASYQIRVLIDVDHSGRISKGDYRSVKRFPVFAGNDSDPLVVEAAYKDY